MSYDELKETVMFDLCIKVALRFVNIDDVPFSRVTLFNFQNWLLECKAQTGINLVELVFDKLTIKQINELALKTDIQRTDYTLVTSNIRKYPRAQLLIKILIRRERILDEADKDHIGKDLRPYLKTSSENYIYGLKSNELPRREARYTTLYMTT